MTRIIIGNYEAPDCEALRVQSESPLASSVTDPMIFSGDEGYAGGDINFEDIIKYDF